MYILLHTMYYYIYIYIYIYINLPVNAIVKLSPILGAELVLAPSADKQTRIVYIYIYIYGKISFTLEIKHFIAQQIASKSKLCQTNNFHSCIYILKK